MTRTRPSDVGCWLSSDERLSLRGPGVMLPTRRQILRLTGVLGALAAPMATLRAQGRGWPSKPIHIIVPGGAGGVTDIRARWLGERLGPALGQPIVVENRSGAGGNVGTVAGARSAPDGYTLVIVHIGTMAINPHLYASPGYDPLTDLIPITRVGVGPQVLAVHKGVPANSIGELLALARAKPSQLTYASPSVGTPGISPQACYCTSPEPRRRTSRTRAAGRRLSTLSSGT